MVELPGASLSWLDRSTKSSWSSPVERSKKGAHRPSGQKPPPIRLWRIHKVTGKREVAPTRQDTRGGQPNALGQSRFLWGVGRGGKSEKDGVHMQEEFFFI